jgi:hypothetical protein
MGGIKMKSIFIIIISFCLFFNQEAYASTIGLNFDISNLKIKVSNTDNSTIINPIDRILGLQLRGNTYKTEGDHLKNEIIFNDIDSKKVSISYAGGNFKNIYGLIEFNEFSDNYKLAAKYLLETPNVLYSTTNYIGGMGVWNNPNNIILNYHISERSRYTIDMSGEYSYDYFLDQNAQSLVAYLNLYNRFFSVTSNNNNFPIKDAIGDWGSYQLELIKGEWRYHEDPIDSIANKKISGTFHLTQFTPYVNAGDYSVNILFSNGIHTVTVGPTYVSPVPASLVLFGSGLVGLAGWRLRKSS